MLLHDETLGDLYHLAIESTQTAVVTPFRIADSYTRLPVAGWIVYENKELSPTPLSRCLCQHVRCTRTFVYIIAYHVFCFSASTYGKGALP